MNDLEQKREAIEKLMIQIKNNANTINNFSQNIDSFGKLNSNLEELLISIKNFINESKNGMDDLKSFLGEDTINEIKGLKESIKSLENNNNNQELENSFQKINANITKVGHYIVNKNNSKNLLYINLGISGVNFLFLILILILK